MYCDTQHLLTFTWQESLSGLLLKRVTQSESPQDRLRKGAWVSSHACGDFKVMKESIGNYAASQNKRQADRQMERQSQAGRLTDLIIPSWNCHKKSVEPTTKVGLSTDPTPHWH